MSLKPARHDLLRRIPGVNLPQVKLPTEVAKAGTTLIVPSNLSDVATLVSSAMTIVGGARQGEAPKPAPKQA